MSQLISKPIKVNEGELKERVVAINRVAKVVKGGRRFSFSAIVVVGDGKGVVGFGLGKANEVTDAISKGIEDAKKNLFQVALLKATVPHEQIGKFSGGFVLLKPAAPGVHDVLAKSKGSSNPHNVVKATVDALVKMRNPHTVAFQRGVSLAKVFNG